MRERKRTEQEEKEEGSEKEIVSKADEDYFQGRWWSGKTAVTRPQVAF